MSDTVKKVTTSIKPTAETEAHPLADLAASELMKIIALTMAKHPIRGYMPDMIEKLVVGGVLMIEATEEEVADEEDEATHDYPC